MGAGQGRWGKGAFLRGVVVDDMKFLDFLDLS